MSLLDVHDAAAAEGIVGRSEELGAITSAITRTLVGQGAALILVAGARGMGKSRVLGAAAAGARRREAALVLAMRGEPLRKSQGFGAIAELLREAVGIPVDAPARGAREALGAWCARHAPGLGLDDLDRLACLLRIADPAEAELGPGVAPPQVRDEIWVATTHLVARAAAAAPVLLVVDDLDAVDDASAELLLHLWRRLSDLRLAILASASADLSEHRIGLAADEPGAVRVALSALDRGDARELVRSTTAAPPDERAIARIVEEAKGSPLVLIELARAFGRAAPREHDAVQSAIRSTLADLPSRQRLGLAFGAALGGRLWQGALAAMGVPEPASLLEELAALALIAPSRASRFVGERQWVLRAGALAQGALDALDLETARAAQLAAGRWLRDRGEDAAVVGEHLVRGGAGEEAAVALEQAAEAAERAGVLAMAQGLAFRAAKLGDPGAPRVRRRLIGVRQGTTGACSFEVLRAEARALIDEATDDPLGRAARAWAGTALFLIGDTSAAHLAWMAEVARSAAAMGEAQTAAWAVRHASFALSVTARQAEAESLLEEVITALPELDPEVEMALAHARGTLLVNSGRPVEGVKHTSLAFDLARATNCRSVGIEIGCDHAYGLLVAGDLAGCLDVLEEVFATAEETGAGLDQVLQNVVEHAGWYGPHDRMDTPLFRRAVARARAVPEGDGSRYAVLLRANYHVFSAFWPDDPNALSTAELLEDEGPLLAASNELGCMEMCATLESASAAMLLRRGSPELALARAESARAFAAKIDLGLYAIDAALAEHDVASALGDTERARKALEDVVTMLRREVAIRAGSRFVRPYLEQIAMHRRVLALCAEHGLAADLRAAAAP